MNALAFLVSPPWMALINLAHLAAVLAALAALAGTTGRRRALAAVLLLAATGWVVTALLSALIIRLPPGARPPSVLAWAPIVSALPTWAAVVVGLASLRRAASAPSGDGRAGLPSAGRGAGAVGPGPSGPA
jgi:hypothetical protein